MINKPKRFSPKEIFVLYLVWNCLLARSIEIKGCNSLRLYDQPSPKRRYDTIGPKGIGVAGSVTRFGDLLDFEQLFKACGNNYFAQIPTFLGIFCKGVKIYHFSSEIIFGQLL